MRAFTVATVQARGMIDCTSKAHEFTGDHRCSSDAIRPSQRPRDCHESYGSDQRV